MPPFIYLAIVFCAWKGLIFFVTQCAPGIGYDTSTNLLHSNSKLLRWDAIYYVHIAQHGHVFEQEWAFGTGLSTLLRWISLDSTITAGAIIACCSHFLSVLLVWAIADCLNRRSLRVSQRRSVPFVAACLHVLSPAGVFLVAPYSESPFSCLNMLGCWLYVQAYTTTENDNSLRKCCLLITSGFAFGCATLIRSNGILSGLPFLIDAFELAWKLTKKLQQREILWSTFSQLAATILAGLSILGGLLLPQYLAYEQYCKVDGTTRVWCTQRLPLIFTFVQSHYWGVGFLRYWTLSNLPLFLLAAPVLGLILRSSIDAYVSTATPEFTTSGSDALIGRLAAPQLALALLAITTYHVQIITRLSSGYPLHYVWLAEKLLLKDNTAKYAVQFFVIYGLIQAGLFASFLPPA